MTGVNAVLLLGHLTRDPELRYTPTGAAVAQFGLGVNCRWRDAQGALQESVCFVDIVTWQTNPRISQIGRSLTRDERPPPCERDVLFAILRGASGIDGTT